MKPINTITAILSDPKVTIGSVAVKADTDIGVYYCLIGITGQMLVEKNYYDLSSQAYQNTTLNEALEKYLIRTFGKAYASTHSYYAADTYVRLYSFNDMLARQKGAVFSDFMKATLLDFEQSPEYKAWEESEYV